MKKIWMSIRLFIEYLFHGMRAADNIILNQDEETVSSGGVNVENKVQNERHKVIHDLLRGEITEEVKELRHEMYLVERESYNYRYNGGGRGKKHMLFGFDGNIDNQEDYDVVLVQECGEIPRSLKEESMDSPRKFTLSIERNFYPSQKIEQFVKMFVVRAKNEKELILDFYFDDYVKQFDRIDRIFHNELTRITEGDMRSDLLDFDSVSTITDGKAFGFAENTALSFKKNVYLGSRLFNGSVILSFSGEKISKKDILEDIWNEKTAEKIKNKAPRGESGGTVAFLDEIGDGYDNEQAENLIKEMKDGRTQD